MLRPIMSLRIATFNLENLGKDALAHRIAALRPVLMRLKADVLCLQEVNAQHVQGGGRAFEALSALTANTPYASHHMVSTVQPDGGPLDVHNLVILSRFPILAFGQLRHNLVDRPLYRTVTAIPQPSEAAAVEWERPLLHAEIALEGGKSLHVINLHLRAPLAAPIPGQKQSPLCWRTAAGWSEGFFLAAIKRAGQALEARLLADRIFDTNPEALIVVAGDLNADVHEMPLRILQADPMDTGNPDHAARALSPVEDMVPQERRFTVRHHARALVLDHLLVSPSLRARLVAADILNEGLQDEVDAAETGALGGSFHAPLIAAFA
jgi:endonuclease/exonuclease/phosphatase family metal-dependent hydrolase